MYCPSCGQEYSQKLNYCKRCGANLTPSAGPAEVKLVRPRLTGMFWAVAVLGLGGLGLSFGILATLATFELRGDELIMPFVFSLMFIFAVAGLLMRQVSRLISAYEQTSQTASFERPALKEPQPARLAAPPEEAASVVEHTTRQFGPAAYKEPIPRE
jgi:hypothetical protein